MFIFVDLWSLKEMVKAKKTVGVRRETCENGCVKCSVSRIYEHIRLYFDAKSEREMSDLMLFSWKLRRECVERGLGDRRHHQ